MTGAHSCAENDMKESITIREITTVWKRKKKTEKSRTVDKVTRFR